MVATLQKTIFTMGLIAFIIPVIFSQTCNLANEGLETSSTFSPPTGWQINGAFVGNINPHTGTNYLGFNSLDDEVITAAYNCPSQLCFYYRASAATANTDLEISYSDDNMATWHAVKTLYFIGENVPISYQYLCIDLPKQNYLFPNNNAVRLRFKQTRRSGGSFYVDDICISSGNCSVSSTRATFMPLPAYCLQANTNFNTEVCITDAQGTIDHSFGGTITLTKNSGAGILQGTTTQTAVQGCANFSNISLSSNGTYVLQATASNGLTGTSGNISLAACPTTDTLTVMTYNTLNFPVGRNDCGGGNVLVPARWDTLRKIIQYTKPDVLMICELHSDYAADSILNRSLNVGTSKYKRATYYVNRSSTTGVLNTMLFYNSQKISLKEQDYINTGDRDVNKYRTFIHDPNLTMHQDTVFIDFYEAHLKAGNFAIDVTDRASEADSIRQYIDRNATTRNSILGGDFNLYSSNEAAYQTLLSGGQPFFDPINSLGAWSANSNFAGIHTQATRFSESLDCGSMGGVDDRFDFLLVSNPILTGAKNVQYIPNSYLALGNNGTTFNQAINSNNNTSSVPDSVLNALLYMSDHLPVLMKLVVHYPQTTSLAVSTINLSAEARMDGNYLSFYSLNSQQVQYYTLERSIDAIHFETIHIGTDDLSRVQHFLDTRIQQGISYYRLTEYTTQGSKVQSPVVSVENTLFWENQYWIYPNPSQDIAYLQINNSKLYYDLYVHIYNTLGQLVDRRVIPIQLGKNTIPMDVADWNSGLYFVQLEWISGTMSLPFIKE